MPGLTRVLTLAAVSLAMPALGQQLATVPVVSGLSRPVFVTAPTGDTGRLFVLEQRSGTTGRVRIVNIPGNTLNATPYLSVTGVATGNEQGLLGLAFHPNFMQNGYFYVNYTQTAAAGSAGSTIVARYRATSGNPLAATADAASAQVLLTIPQPDANHNAGWMAFGPDGMLYIATGDGGCGNDSTCTNPASAFPHVTGGNAQSLTANLLGKMLRIDVDGPDNIPGNADDADPGLGLPYRIPAGNPFNGTNGLREIFAYGLRNPWRNGFDRLTGDLWIADVGQDQREEINFVPAGGLAGLNFGWRCMEGTRCTGLSGCVCNGTNLVLPILEYGHTAVIQPTGILGCSISGGYVYRGSAIPCLQGAYIFSDYCSGDIFTFKRSPGGVPTEVTQRRTELDPPGAAVINSVTSFGEDAAGELYICDQNGGEVFKIVLGAGGCGCDADFNVDGNVDQGDVDYLINVVAGGNNPTGRDPDFNVDGNTDQGDIDALINVVAGGNCP